MRSQIRFLSEDSFDGAMNMAIDEAILESFITGESGITLRLYRFSPPAVTLGLNQNLAPDLVSHIRQSGVDVVRRPTGGRAVLHMDDITYSFVAGDRSLPGGLLSTSVTASYKEICQGLLNAFSILGVNCQLGQSGSAYRHLSDCFKATTSCDLHFQGVKVMGSAQVRRRGAVLQHGSAPLNQGQLLMSSLLREPEQTARHANLQEVAGKILSRSMLEQAFRVGFAQAFDAELVDGCLTEEELSLASARKTRFELPVFA